MAHIFLIKAPWTNKDFSFLKELEAKFSMPLLIFSPFAHEREKLLAAGFRCHNPYKFRSLGENKGFLYVVVDWPRFKRRELEEFRYFLLLGECPCLLLQAEELFLESSYLEDWVMGESVVSLWEGECSFPPFDSLAMQQNLKFLAEKCPPLIGPLVYWLLMGRLQGNLLGWEGENQNRGNRHQEGSFSRKTCDRYFDDEKWSQRLGPFLWRSGWWKKAQSLNFRARLHDAGGDLSFKNENRAA